MIEIYEGSGKGKTTAAAGLAVRAAGHGVPVLFTQFLKDGSSGEIRVLKSIPGAEVLMPELFFGFTWEMTGEQRENLRGSYESFLDKVFGRAALFEERKPDAEVNGVVILDEILTAVEAGLADGERLLKRISLLPAETEVVLTGRKAPESLLEAADYVSRIESVRHPYDRGIPARRGIEF